MSNFIVDTLADQIERGEVFFGSHYYVSVGAGGSYSYCISTGGSNCSLIADIRFGQTTQVTIQEGAVAHSGSLQTLYNMNRGSSNTINTTLRTGATVPGGLTTIYDYIVSQSDRGADFDPLSREIGIVLPANSYYYITGVAYGNQPTIARARFFLRENV